MKRDQVRDQFDIKAYLHCSLKILIGSQNWNQPKCYPNNNLSILKC